MGLKSFSVVFFFPSPISLSLVYNSLIISYRHSLVHRMFHEKQIKQLTGTKELVFYQVQPSNQSKPLLPGLVSRCGIELFLTKFQLHTMHTNNEVLQITASRMTGGQLFPKLSIFFQLILILYKVVFESISSQDSTASHYKPRTHSYFSKSSY